MRKVIYTCITGAYDELLQPLVIDESFDYVCYTDCKKNDRDGVWRIEQLPDMNVGKIKASRFPKMNPHIILKDYDYSVYVDANIVIQQNSFYQSIDRCIKSGYILAGIKHPKVSCLYDEYFNVYMQRKETDLKQLYKEYQVIKRTGFPRNFGMFEANIIFRAHNNQRVIQQCDDWWNMYLAYTKRDQLSYSYTIWKNNIELKYIMKPCGLHSNEHDSYKVLLHTTPNSSKTDFLNKLLFKIFPVSIVRKFFYLIFNF